MAPRARVDPADVTVGSKWGYRYVGEWRMDAPVHEVKDHSISMLQAQLPESRELLGPWLRLYQVHSATLESGILGDAAVLAELARLRAEDGLVIGLSVSGPRQGDVVRAALEVRVDGVNPFDCVQATWNVLEPSAGPALAEAYAAGWGVIVKEALANGRVLEDDAALAPIADAAERHRTTRDAIALAAALAQPWAGVVLSGAATPDQLRSNVAAVDVTLEADDRGVARARRAPRCVLGGPCRPRLGVASRHERPVRGRRRGVPCARCLGEHVPSRPPPPRRRPRDDRERRRRSRSTG